MQIICAFSVAVRLAVLTFVVGLIFGLAIGYRAAGPDRAPAPGTAVQGAAAQNY
jgi:hypothetical protein